ncbi:corticotropin-releasing factor receptor 2-like [Hydractinia symbiolongicarpus]|uniref:corticotropin-releasing factor receptor 2-like n=1 Tax=Hydractinia symbiolongicarpus TaxID=13093 RepID=UPI00254E2B3D|nr:corticotropin-releasing factor receptor 2-like [Hydractinia symbiolongicarpus]
MRFFRFLLLLTTLKGTLASVPALVQLAFKLHTICITNISALNFVEIFNRSHCKIETDSYFHCWPNTLKNKVVEMPCSTIFFFKGSMVKRRCLQNNTWEKINYNDFCTPLPKDVKDNILDNLLIKYNFSTQKELDRADKKQETLDRINTMQLVFRSIDLSVCVGSFIALLVLIPLKNPRIMLHRNLIVSFILNDIVQILISEEYPAKTNKHQEGCSALFVAIMYLVLAQVCWMFNEGIFQCRQFFFVFIQKKYIWAHMLFGWVFPAIVVLCIYFPAMYIDPPVEDFKSCWANYNLYKYNYIIYGTLFILLLLNVLMVVYLMWIIWSKLKSDENQQLNKTRKALRGFFILVVLLGSGYLFSIYGPVSCEEFLYLRSLIFSFQGTFVCFGHVFFSREVKEAAKVLYGRQLDSFQLTRSTNRGDSTGYDYNRRPSLFDRRFSAADARRTSVISIASGTRLSTNNNKVFPQTNPPATQDSIMEEVETAFQAQNAAYFNKALWRDEDLPDMNKSSEDIRMDNTYVNTHDQKNSF